MRHNQGKSQIAGNPVGRPPVTDHGTIERVAFDLFERNGFAQTRTVDIADAVGISRRTLFRYFPTKNDIPWGQFDAGLNELRRTLFTLDTSMPIGTAVREGIVTFNSLDPQQIQQHVRRMRIILSTQELQAHAALKYAQWRRVIADFVAHRLDVAHDAPEPTIAGHAALAIALSAYDLWLIDPQQTLSDVIRECYARSETLWRE